MSITAEWKTAAALALLRQRRAEGVSFGVIARELGCTTNGAVSAAHMLNLPRGPVLCMGNPWTADEIAILTVNSVRLIREFAELLPDRTKHAIQRKRNNLKLAGPPMPGRHSPQPSAPVPTLAPLAALEASLAPLEAPEAPPPYLPPEPPQRPPEPPQRLSWGCQWPIGEPKTPGFRFCEASRVQDGPYCQAHCRIAYTRRPNAG